MNIGDTRDFLNSGRVTVVYESGLSHEALAVLRTAHGPEWLMEQIASRRKQAQP